jgi:hypothetical protein
VLAERPQEVLAASGLALGALQLPPIVSWPPAVSATIVISGRATSEYSVCPRVSRSVRARLIVFGAW